MTGLSSVSGAGKICAAPRQYFLPTRVTSTDRLAAIAQRAAGRRVPTRIPGALASPAAPASPPGSGVQVRAGSRFIRCARPFSHMSRLVRLRERNFCQVSCGKLATWRSSHSFLKRTRTGERKGKLTESGQKSSCNRCYTPTIPRYGAISSQGRAKCPYTFFVITIRGQVPRVVVRRTVEPIPRDLPRLGGKNGHAHPDRR